MPTRAEKLAAIQAWETQRQTYRDDHWVEDVKQESLEHKYNRQIVQMDEMHVAKLARVQADYAKYQDFPDAVKWEIHEQLKDVLSGPALASAINDQFAEQELMMQWKVAKLRQSIARIQQERSLRARGYVLVDKEDNGNPLSTTGVPPARRRQILGTTYYIDSDAGNDGNAGTHPTTSPWASFDQFCENARVAGDIAIARNGRVAAYDTASNLTFTSDGTILAPLVLTADYDDAWSDHVDLSVTATATLTFGSKTVTFSSDISGVLAAGDVIYVSGDDSEEFAYEVKTVVTTTVTLYLPYIGNNAGSGKTVFNMQSKPFWSAISGTIWVQVNGDDYWTLSGLTINGDVFSGPLQVSSSLGAHIANLTIAGNGGNKGTVTNSPVLVEGSRIYNVLGGAEVAAQSLVKNCLIDCNSVATSVGLITYGGCEVTQVEFAGCVDDWRSQTTNVSRDYGRNVIFSGSDSAVETYNDGTLIEDYNGTPSDSRQFTEWSTTKQEDVVTVQSETSTVRSGGSVIAVKVTPTTTLSSSGSWRGGKWKLLDIPIYATTASKTYEIYFRPTATTDWTADPTASELWVELSAWGHATNNFRKVTKSTGTIDMNGSTAWAALSVTVAPAQAGVAYLRVWYCKTKEGGKANTFFMDPIPVIT